MIENPDVSSYQGQVDWQAEKNAGVVLGACKATEGTGWTDPTFRHNWDGMAAAALTRIGYHFAHPGNNVAAEVAHFRQVVGPLGPDDHIAMDLEIRGTLAGAAVPQWGLAFCMECERQFQVGPDRIMVYTGRWFIDGTGGPSAWQVLADRYPDGYWYSAYQAQLIVERLAPWTRCCLWQNTDASRQPGANGVCDGNLVENGGYFVHPAPVPAIPYKAFPPMPFDLGGPMAAVPVQFTTDASGHFDAAVDLPAGCTKIVAVSVDLGSVFQGSWDPAEKVFAFPAVGNPKLDRSKQGEFYICGAPNHFYTGTVICA